MEGKLVALEVLEVQVREFEEDEDHEEGELHTYAILREKNGSRIAFFHLCIGSIGESLKAMLRTPGEPFILHERMVAMLRSVSAEITRISFQKRADDPTRVMSTVELSDAHGAQQHKVALLDMIGFSIATRLPIIMDEDVFASVAASAPTLEQLGIASTGPASLESATNIVLKPDDPTIGRA